MQLTDWRFKEVRYERWGDRCGSWMVFVRMEQLTGSYLTPVVSLHLQCGEGIDTWILRR